jgi:hypothetical protein
VAGSTCRLLGDVFELRHLGRYMLKGLANPVEAWAVEGVSVAESRFDAVRASRLTGLIGREQEMGRLFDRKSVAWRGEGQIVLVSGEAGVGGKHAGAGA